MRTSKHYRPQKILTFSSLWHWTDHQLEDQGRLTHPMIFDHASDRYLPISWEDAKTNLRSTIRGLWRGKRALGAR